MALTSGMPPPALRAHSPNAIELSSNNPFRSRASPNLSPTRLDLPPTRPDNRMSRNPFLDSNAIAAVRNTSREAPPPTDFFADLSLLDRSQTNDPQRAMMPPRPQRLPAKASPTKRDAIQTHVRRASDSSVAERERLERRERDRDLNRDRSQRAPRTESEERRRRERRKEREEQRQKRDKDRSKRPQRGLDIIDKLDVTGVYGYGVFHHDGPFDACNPHRNFKKDARAPMQAFPAGSANMALGGSGPVSSQLDLDKYHGRGDEGFTDFATARRAGNQPTIINPTDRVEPVHGRETTVLGTSTFLDGAPAGRGAPLARRPSDEQAVQDGPPLGASVGGGLTRKKSLAQRLRGMSGTRRDRPGEFVRSPEARYNAGISPPVAEMRAVSAGGRARAQQQFTNENEVNPFDNEYDAAFARKGTQIRIIEDQSRTPLGRARAPSSPRPNNAALSGSAPLTRSKTEDSSMLRPSTADRASPDSEEKPSLLSRMKSLRGGRRTRPERRGE